MTDREKAIVMAYTGVVMLKGDKLDIFYQYVREKLGHCVMMHELAFPEVHDAITDAAKNDFIELANGNDASTVGGWISIKDKWPERAGKYLVVSKTALAELPPHVKTALFLNNLRDNPQFEYEGEPNEPGFYNGDGEGDWVERYVTHWMPLPEPPKEG